MIPGSFSYSVTHTRLKVLHHKFRVIGSIVIPASGTAAFSFF